MSQKDLNLLLANFDEIADRVQRLSPPLQEVAFSALVEALFQPAKSPTDDSPLPQHMPQIQEPTAVDNEEADQDSMLREYYQKYGLEYINDMEFATFVAYFHSKIVPSNYRVQAISSVHYEHACKITGRKVPGSVGGTLNNARKRGFLERRGTGLFSLDDIGSEYISDTLIREA